MSSLSIILKTLQSINIANLEASVKKILKFVDIGYTSSNLLLFLVEDILDLGKIEQGIFHPIIEKFYLRRTINDVLKMFSIDCQQK
jgi:signal transduction histidine kinase